MHRRVQLTRQSLFDQVFGILHQLGLVVFLGAYLLSSLTCTCRSRNAFQKAGNAFCSSNKLVVNYYESYEGHNLESDLLQGYLDEQFVQLEELQDDVNPNFVEEVVTLYYRDSARLIYSIEQALEKGSPDFMKLDGYMHQFKGSSTSIGAKKVKAASTVFGDYCKSGNAEGCRKTFQQLKKEYAMLKKKLVAYFQLARQAGPVETACRPP